MTKTISLFLLLLGASSSYAEREFDIHGHGEPENACCEPGSAQITHVTDGICVRFCDQPCYQDFSLIGLPEAKTWGIQKCYFEHRDRPKAAGRPFMFPPQTIYTE